MAAMFSLRSIIRLVLLVAVVAVVPACAPAPLREPTDWRALRSEGMALQSHEFTCGAAALATTLTMLGRPTREEEVLAAVLADTDFARLTESGMIEIPPLSAAHLQRVARKFGYRSVTLQAASGDEALAALGELKPVICRLLIYEDYLHFVVVSAIENGWVLIADPAYGHARLPVARFREVWEKGDRVLLAVSALPFPAWRNDEGQVFVRRDASETIAVAGEAAPLSLFHSPRRSVIMGNTTFRQNTGVP
jgi:hypothetical protein